MRWPPGTPQAALLERHFSDVSPLGKRLRILKGVAWAAHASEEAQHPGLRSLLGQGFGVVAGAAMAPHLAESFGAGGNARDWRIDLFKKARGGLGRADPRPAPETRRIGPAGP
jgi:hypothetical protein